MYDTRVTWEDLTVPNLEQQGRVKVSCLKRVLGPYIVSQNRLA